MVEQGLKKKQKDSVVRRVLPTNIELNSRDNVKRADIVISLVDVKEAVKVYMPTPEEMATLHTIEERERINFQKFHERFPDFDPILNIQRNATDVLTSRKLQALDRMQEIDAAKTRLIHQSNACPDADEIIRRIQSFSEKYKTTENVPLLDMKMAGRNKKTIEDLKNVLDWLVKNNYKKVAFIFRNDARVREEWSAYFRSYVGMNFDEVYMLQVPAKIDNFEGNIAAFIRSATKVAHRTGRPIGEYEPRFIEPTWELKTIEDASEGVVKYNGLTRKEFLKKDGRISAIKDFAKWDRVVQANELCRTELSLKNIQVIPALQKAFRNFS